MEKFEGTEKKLKIVFSSPEIELRDNRDGLLERAVRASQAEIINRISASGMDAYLLSESSLFVWSNQLLLITCGKTTPVMAIPEILKTVEKSDIESVFYERCSSMFPELQPTGFHEDRALIESYFGGHYKRLGIASKDHMNLYYAVNNPVKPSDELTIKVMMYELDADIAAVFSRQCPDFTLKRNIIGRLEKIYPVEKRDSYFFDPQGYSLNAVNITNYYTVHVTPQDGQSYAGFETNFIDPDFNRVLDRIISMFVPGRFSVFMVSSLGSRSAELFHHPDIDSPGYLRSPCSKYIFGNMCAVRYWNFSRTDNIRSLPPDDDRQYGHESKSSHVCSEGRRFIARPAENRAIIR